MSKIFSKNLNCFIGAAGLLLFFIPYVSFCMERTTPFSMGEKLIYQIRWGVVDAGEAVLEEPF